MRSASHPSDTTNNVEQQIRALEELDLREHSVEDLLPRIRALLEGQTLRSIAFAPGLLLYRGIPCEELPARLSEVSYPPADRVQHDQRANRAGSPMFYCSATWHPPFFEAGVKRGDKIVITRWKTRTPLRISSFGYADVCADDPHADREQSLCEALNQLPDHVRPLAEFLTSAFTRAAGPGQEHHYRLSAAIAEACQLGEAFDGLLYPSAAMPSPAHNLALHPRCIDEEKLELQYVEHLVVNRVEPASIDVCSLDFAHVAGPDGTLSWLGRPGNWVLREGGAATNCRFQNGRWEAG
ncbi:RES family NAD+ phosphorylase [Hymenobacter sp. BT175]|uniref:RES domain-containing protein n=1 Tax=Hymenobacter translucens TaxID=2886507 RepID=UPI001D0F19D9|nr:RES domain-containing protein [Hymenobacter translucens]MCC2547182.1 RES family NAD+ phosphorylase [Hymenobacter translucens]